MTTATAITRRTFLDRTETILDALAWQNCPYSDTAHRLFNALVDTRNAMVDLDLECQNCRTSEPRYWEPGFCTCEVTLGVEITVTECLAKLRRAVALAPPMVDVTSVLLVELIARARIAYLILRPITVWTPISDVHLLPREAVEAIEGC